MYIDTHAHLNYPEKYGDLPQLLAKIAAAGVDTVINVGWDPASSALAAEQAERFAAQAATPEAEQPERPTAQAEHSAAEGLAAEAPTAAPAERFAAETPTATSAGCPALYFAAGFHPSNLQDYQTGDEERLASLLQSPKGVAVGEIGLDYHYEDTDEAAQKRAFCAQLELAEALSLPVIIHSRDAAADTLRILKDNRAKLRAGGVSLPILCLGETPPELASQLHRWKLTQTVADAAHGQALATCQLPLSVRFHGQKDLYLPHPVHLGENLLHLLD